MAELSGGGSVTLVVMLTVIQFNHTASCQVGLFLSHDILRSEDRKMGIDFPIENLSVPQKLELMERIWTDLEQRPDEIPSPEWHGDVLAKRLAEIESGDAEFVDWDIARKQLLDRHE